MDVNKAYVQPHKLISQECENADVAEIKKDAEIMYDLCFKGHGSHKGAFAIAHPQINDSRPLRFFVTSGNYVIINPVITNHTKFEINKFEGCMSFPFSNATEVKRWNKIEVEYQEIDGDKLSEIRRVKLNGLGAEIWQHEIDHLNGKYVFKI